MTDMALLMSAPTYTCMCRCTFTLQNHFTQHQQCCSPTKKHLSSAISTFKELVACRKKLRILEHDAESVVIIASLCQSSNSPTNHVTLHEVNSVTEPKVITALLLLPSSQDMITPDLNVGGNDRGDTLSVAERRPRCQNHQLPKQFRDILPLPLPTAPLGVSPAASVSHKEVSSQSPILSLPSVFRTPSNIFGLVQQYFTSTPPSHNPEEYVTLTDLLFIPGNSHKEPDLPTTSGSDAQYHPYPNRSSFQLGEWYWNQGVQKSQSDYMKLLKILGDTSFDTTDVSSTHWKKSTPTLASTSTMTKTEKSGKMRMPV